MKVLILAHTIWIDLLANQWERAGLQVVKLTLPVSGWDNAIRNKMSEIILGYIEVEQPDFILDINGVGVMPSPSSDIWTSEAAGTIPWIEWWWDDPVNTVNNIPEAPARKEAALKSPNVIHFFWDATLAKEYGEWWNIKTHFLPTAAHPEAYSPESGKNLRAKYQNIPLCFLGTYYPETALLPSEENSELVILSAKRRECPKDSYFDLSRKYSEAVPEFTKLLTNATAFSSDIIQMRNRLNELHGNYQRSRVLSGIVEKMPQGCFFGGKGWPEKYKANPNIISHPSELSALYYSAEISLDIRNGQSFTGSNMRCYEIMSSGGVLACSEYPDFDPDGSLNGKIYFRFSSAEELVDILKELRANPRKNASIKRDAHKYAIEHHSWLNRLHNILKVLDSHN